MSVMSFTLFRQKYKRGTNTVTVSAALGRLRKEKVKNLQVFMESKNKERNQREEQVNNKFITSLVTAT